MTLYDLKLEEKYLLDRFVRTSPDNLETINRIWKRLRKVKELIEEKMKVAK